MDHQGSIDRQGSMDHQGSMDRRGSMDRGLWTVGLVRSNEISILLYVAYSISCMVSHF